MNPWLAVIWAVLLVSWIVADVSITISGWQSSPSRITETDPSPGPTRWH